MVKQPCPNFRVITANIWVSELLGVLRYTTSITLSLVFELISVSYPNHVRLRVKCIDGVLTSHLGSNLDPYYNQNRVITNGQLYQDNISCVMRKPVYAICEQKRHRSASLYAFHSQSNSPLLHVYTSYTPLDCKMHQFFLLSRPRKKICVFTIA